MGQNSSIEWTDHTFNPWWGCVRVSPGCVHCYAETFDRRVHGVGKEHWGVRADRRFFGDKHWNEPFRWNGSAEAEGVRRRVFCASMADVFEDRPDLVPQRERLFRLIEATPALDWLLLTKRPENMVRLAAAAGWSGRWPENVWAGCTVEDQQRADERIPELLRVPARVRFLSCEPLIGPVSFRWAAWVPLGPGETNHLDGLRGIHWVICGGESGAGARPMQPEWARSLRDQCTAAGVAFHFKQWGQHDAELVQVKSKHEAGRVLDGRTWDEWPAVAGVGGMTALTGCTAPLGARGGAHAARRCAMSEPLRAPFPWFGGKSRVASLVWERFGDVPNYVEPFAGSLAVLLGRPGWDAARGAWKHGGTRTETVNDLDCYLANFWRATATDPEAVGAHADWPVNEADLLARHQWLVSQGDFRERMRSDPHYADAKVAGWWVWGICQWIGSGWCAHARVPDQLPHLGNAGMGIHRPAQKLPHLGDAGMGIHRPAQKLPHLGDAGRGEVSDYLALLASRLRRVRVACGEWDRVLGDSVTFRHGATGIFLDPPYDEAEHTVDYAAGTGSVAREVRAWAAANGDNPLLRIALCGYAGEHDELVDAGWGAVAWKARGGYGSQGEGRGRENANRERIWFSPHCLAPAQPGLFDAEVAA